LDNLFQALTTLDPPQEIWLQIEQSRFMLARRGIQASIIDLWIAITAEYHHSDLWTLDKDFENIKEVIPISLYSS